jgi:hypothetical protein
MTFGFKFAIIHGRVSILGVGFFFFLLGRNWT